VQHLFVSSVSVPHVCYLVETIPDLTVAMWIASIENLEQGATCFDYTTGTLLALTPFFGGRSTA
jgi:hypothetical protein